MTALPAGAGRMAPALPRAKPIRVEVLVCGSLDRGDDGAACVAAPLLHPAQPDDVRLRVVGQLDIDDLLDVPAGAAVVVMDAATGIRPGQVVSLPLNGLIGDAVSVRPRSSHALAFPEVVGLAELIRGRPIRGRIVAIGAVDFALGQTLSDRVHGAIPAFVDAVCEAINELRRDSLAGART